MQFYFIKKIKFKKSTKLQMKLCKSYHDREQIVDLNCAVRAVVAPLL